MLGRFVSCDPLGYRDGNNLYRARFVVKGLDPTGTQYIVTPAGCERAKGIAEKSAFAKALNAKGCKFKIICKCCKPREPAGGFPY